MINLTLDERLTLDRFNEWAQTANERALRGHPYEQKFILQYFSDGIRMLVICEGCQSQTTRSLTDEERAIYFH